MHYYRMPRVDQEYLEKCKLMGTQASPPSQGQVSQPSAKIQSFEAMQTRSMAAKHVPADLPLKNNKNKKDNKNK